MKTALKITAEIVAVAVLGGLFILLAVVFFWWLIVQLIIHA